MPWVRQTAAHQSALFRAAAARRKVVSVEVTSQILPKLVGVTLRYIGSGPYCCRDTGQGSVSATTGMHAAISSPGHAATIKAAAQAATPQFSTGDNERAALGC